MRRFHCGIPRVLISFDCVGLPPDAVEVPLLVCTCHIHWDPEYCDVKLIQTMMLMNELKSIVERESTSQMSLRPNSNPSSTSPASNIQLMLCGDFNSLPNSGESAAFSIRVGIPVGLSI